jgi:hypothetical protein
MPPFPKERGNSDGPACPFAFGSAALRYPPPKARQGCDAQRHDEPIPGGTGLSCWAYAQGEAANAAHLVQSVSKRINGAAGDGVAELAGRHPGLEVFPTAGVTIW